MFRAQRRCAAGRTAASSRAEQRPRKPLCARSPAGLELHRQLTERPVVAVQPQDGLGVEEDQVESLQWLGRAAKAGFAAAQAVDAAVARQAQQPGEKGLAFEEAVESGINAKEDLLGGVPGLLAVAQEVQRHAEDPPLILPDERLPGEVVALATAFEQSV